jgi:hypothetical protein
MTMDKFYQLWDWTSGNVAGEWDTVEEALDDIARAYDKAGMEMTDDYGLLMFNGDEESIYAQGQELVDLVKTHKHAMSR